MAIGEEAEDLRQHDGGLPRYDKNVITSKLTLDYWIGPRVGRKVVADAPGGA